MRISQSRVGMVFIQTLLETTNLDVLLNRLLSIRVAVIRNITTNNRSIMV